MSTTTKTPEIIQLNVCADDWEALRRALTAAAVVKSRQPKETEHDLQCYDEECADANMAVAEAAQRLADTVCCGPVDTCASASPEGEALRRLEDAAPDLLTACKSALELIELGTPYADLTTAQELRATIRLAEVGRD